MLLASTSATLSLVTSSTSAVDACCEWADLVTATGAVTPGGANSAVTTATTTTIVGNPAAGAVRRLKEATLRNKGASANTVTVRLNDGTVTAEIVRAVLAPDMALHYHEAAGWWLVDGQGRKLQVNMSFAGTPVADADAIVRLTADVVNANATANTIADVTGLAFPVLTGKLFWFEFNILYHSAATATGSRWSINGPTFSALSYTSEYSLTANTTTRNALLQGYDLPAATNATTGALTNNWALIYGIIVPTADGNVTARFASEVALSAITAKAESFVRYRQITP